MSNLPDPSEESTGLMRLPAGGELVRLAESELGLARSLLQDGTAEYWINKIASCSDVITGIITDHGLRCRTADDGYWDPDRDDYFVEYEEEYEYTQFVWTRLPELSYFVDQLLSVDDTLDWAWLLKGLVRLHLVCESYEISQGWIPRLYIHLIRDNPNEVRLIKHSFRRASELSTCESGYFSKESIKKWGDELEAVIDLAKKSSNSPTFIGSPFNPTSEDLPF